ncbi:carbohydrate ABC transporter permease [Tessaracoccus lubricantis]|uniref:carbohydrate ABC transporter permease n=1 Tax=Tessaracoccus lubricantis TaxID=545543 RepID=UPI0031ECCC0B
MSTALATRGPAATPQAPSGASRPRARRRHRLVPQWFLIPALVLYVIVVVYPSIAGGLYAFTDWRGGNAATFTGMDNFRKLLADQAAVASLRNTLVIAVTLTIVQSGLGLLLALALNSAIRARNLLRTLFFAPMMMPPVIVGLLWQYVYTPDGPLDTAMNALGLSGLVQSWLGNSSVALWSVIASVIWHHVGMSMVIFLAGLQGIPDELYEAASIDGATKLRQFFAITWPLLGQAITIATALTMTSSLKLFDQVFIMTGGGPGVSTQTLSLIMYREAFVYGEYGYGSAIALVLTMIVAFIVFIQMSITRRGEVDA